MCILIVPFTASTIRPTRPPVLQRLRLDSLNAQQRRIHSERRPRLPPPRRRQKFAWQRGWQGADGDQSAEARPPHLSRGGQRLAAIRPTRSSGGGDAPHQPPDRPGARRNGCAGRPMGDRELGGGSRPPPADDRATWHAGGSARPRHLQKPGICRRNPNGPGRTRTTQSLSSFVRVFVRRRNAGRSRVLVRKNHDPPTAFCQRGACPDLCESLSTQPGRLEAGFHDSPRS